MPSLLVLRHGKSDWYADYGSDVDRPLAKRGRRAAQRIGRHLAAVGPEPDVALTSPAVRARHTLERVMKFGGFDCPVRVEESFYGQGHEAVIDSLRLLDGSVEAALVVGHEPTWSDLIAALTGELVRFPTGALAHLELGTAWPDLRPGGAVLSSLVLPRHLGAEGP